MQFHHDSVNQGGIGVRLAVDAAPTELATNTRRPDDYKDVAPPELAAGGPQPEVLELHKRPKRTHHTMTMKALTVLLMLSALPCIHAGTPPVDMDLAAAEVSRCYGKAHPEVQEFVLHTARSFGLSGMWLNEGAFATLKPEQREGRIVYLARLFEDAEYGRHLCAALAEASALKDPRLVPGLMKVAAYHVDDRDYDCRPKWMAIAALARQESPEATPLLVSLVDHGNQNTRFWARAALARMAKEDFKADKQAWNQWWITQGHAAIDPKFLRPYAPPVSK